MPLPAKLLLATSSSSAAVFCVTQKSYEKAYQSSRQVMLVVTVKYLFIENFTELSNCQLSFLQCKPDDNTVCHRTTETLNFEFHFIIYLLVLLWLLITHLLFLFHHLSQILITTYPAASNSSHFCLLSVSYPCRLLPTTLQSLPAVFLLPSPLHFPTVAVSSGGRLHRA